MHYLELESLLNKELNVAAFKDYTPNGLQVEGRHEIKSIITGVTACQALLNQAIAQKADAIIVHHGYFWKNEQAPVRGMLRNRLKTLLSNDVNLYAYHLPLDAHPVLGNNAQLANLLKINTLGYLDPLVPYGELASPILPEEFSDNIAQILNRPVLYCADNAPAKIHRIGWCTGGGQNYISLAVEAGLDAFITGEVSEKTIHIARENGIHFFAAGHHATERYGIKALGEWLQQYQLSVKFIDIDNPA